MTLISATFWPQLPGEIGNHGNCVLLLVVVETESGRESAVTPTLLEELVKGNNPLKLTTAILGIAVSDL